MKRSADDLFKYVTNIVDKINNTNGFAVTGWCQKEVVNDQSNNDTKEEAPLPCF